jgi:hypothetical protein
MAAVLAAIPLLAAMAAGVAMVRRHRRVGRRSALVLRWPVLVAASVVASVIGGLALGFAGWFAGGALGSRYLAVTGPDPIRLGTSAALVIGLGVLAGAAVQNLLGGLGRRPPAQ